MSFDGIVTRAVADELTETLLNGRVSKIYQPYKSDLVFVIRSGRKNHHLLVSANPSFSRIHVTEQSYDNPKEPPMFCMLLRKHLDGSILEKIEQVEMERIFHLTFRTRNELGDVSYRKLIIEIMGRHSNIILVNEENMILDSIKHLSPAVNRHRTVLPGQPYVAPPAQEKISPLEVDEEQFLHRIDFNSGKLDRQIVNEFSGVSPLIAKEVLSRAGLANRASLTGSFFEVMDKVRNREYVPQMVFTENKEFFSVVELSHLEGEKKTFDSVSELLDRFYFGKAERDRVKQQTNDLEKFLVNERKKNVKKIKKLESTLKSAEKADEFQLYGELLTANMHAVKRGDKNIEVINYYDENGATIDIPLDPQKTPSENAQDYFKKYNKAKNSLSIVNEQIENAHEEIDYLDQLIQQLESASPRDVEEIREELEEQGYIRKRSKRTKPTKNTRPTLDRYVSSDGTELLVGKNNKQNEYLTNRLASKTETWLHTKDIPGSHVVIRNPEFTEQTLLEAANLAAYFSKARESGSVPVDYTLIKHVKKPSGAKPGYVTYDNQNTVYVTPDPDLVLQLKRNV
ncbi:Rqc2 family fibronectin-binding protein [Pseudalkalibacillus caeni]|uniref:Rqc2 homolog RqcH n=1 Tax=Exobacillus caeni TaxID=2574798 RepID=A0A5R9F2Z9_9BACL|nr:NFACT RNA binding domain-containing protein [Pseudalkalibacillus caeni]TLS35273.1 fibronectin/fibrinogen-binding protein [Pseudalkalibacillus caeni]